MRLLPKPKPMPAIDGGISNGAEFAGVVIVFFLIGLGVDAWAGTTPWFMIALTVFGMCGHFVRVYYAYSARMESLEAERAEISRGVQQ